jgi:predicted component of type VI protein secretion system
MPWLAHGTTTRELRDGDTVVGSAADADWRVTTAELTARHFLVRLQDGVVTLEANSPDTVVAVDGRQIRSACPLRDGETILAGSGRFSFCAEAPAESAEGPAPDLGSGIAYLVNDLDRVAHPLDGRSTTIGRDTSNAVVIRDPAASRFHAEVRREAGGFTVHSMGAMRTLVNRRPVDHPSMLSDGDVIEVAFVRLRFARELPGGVALAAFDPEPDEESGRRPTLEPVERVVVDEASPAGRHMRRVQVLVGLGVVLAAALWWTLGRRG